MRDDLSKTGYGREEEYFFKLNKELIEKRRKELDKARTKQEEQVQKTVHWMKCPKCGHDMKEVDMVGIKVDKCDSCKGIYFDHGELDLLFETREPESFLGKLRQLFS